MLEENGYSMDYGDQYMEQEEEWEREGLLDPAWEKQQKKVSTAHPIEINRNGKMHSKNTALQHAIILHNWFGGSAVGSALSSSLENL